MNYTYILRCEDGSLYTGWTNDLQKRYQAHRCGKGAKYTKAHRPIEIAYYEEFEDKIDAMKREYVIKHMRRSQKEELIHTRKNKE